LLRPGEFIEIFIDTPLAQAEARAGKLKNFTGIDSPYEPPANPELRIDTLTQTAEQAAEAMVEWLLKNQ
jgi:bifunctional enzyme CysN/CysC